MSLMTHRVIGPHLMSHWRVLDPYQVTDLNRYDAVS